MQAVPKLKKRKKPTGLGDGMLRKYWRQAVFIVYGKCVMCGCVYEPHLEVHHIIHKAHKILRWDWRNGVPVCRPLTGRNCHQKSDTLAGREQVRRVIGEASYLFLKEMQPITALKYCTENQISTKQFVANQKQTLQDIISDGGI